MANIYFGKASKLEYAASNDFPGTDLGEMKSLKISFEPEVFEGLADDHGVGGYGLLEAELAEATAARRTALEALVNTVVYIQATSTAGKTFVVYGPLTLGEERDFSDPKNPHVLKIRIRRYCDIASDFCEAPADPE